MCTPSVWNQTSAIEAGATSTTGVTPYLLYNPYDVSFDGYGNMYVVDTSNHRIQRYAQGAHVGSTVAGNSGTLGYGRSELYNPFAIRVSENGTMFILDSYNYRVIRWATGDPLGTVVVNGRGSGSTLDRIGLSNGLFLDTSSNIFVSDTGNNRVTKWFYNNNTIGFLVD